MKIKLNKPFARDGQVDEYDVRQIKKALNRMGYYRPHEETGITGIPDNAVFTALKKFQKEHGMLPTGTAKPGDETVEALSSEAAKTKSGKYVWRTVGDDKVRGSHAVLNGTVRDYADSPDPGEDFNCRCWAEPVSDEIEREELPPPNIPGTNIPDRGIPEQGGSGVFDPGKVPGDEDIDPSMEVKPPSGSRTPVIDPAYPLPPSKWDI